MNEDKILPDDEPPIPMSLDGAHKCSEPLYVFFRRHSTIFEFFFFGLRMATFLDQTKLIAAKALALSGKDEDLSRLEKLENNKNPFFKHYTKFSMFQVENICIRSVDNFFSYLSEILQSSLIKRPQMLASSEMISLGDVLRHSSRKELLAFLVEKKIIELTHGGINAIEKYILDRTNIKLTQDAKQRARLAFAIELRNIYTHNRGVMNDAFLKRLKLHQHGYTVEKGKRYHADYDELISLANNMAEIVKYFDKSITVKHGLKTKHYSTWLNQQHNKRKN